MTWYVYIVECKDKTLYTGSTNDVARRVREHNTSNVLGSRFTRSRRPVKVVFREAFKTRSEALKREAAIKRYTREKKLELLSVA
jgi:putative endonuclease